MSPPPALYKVSLPSPPFSWFTPLLPSMVLFSALPVPLIAAAPVSARFSMLAPNVRLTLEKTLSISPTTALVSLVTSPLASTT